MWDSTASGERVQGLGLGEKLPRCLLAHLQTQLDHRRIPCLSGLRSDGIIAVGIKGQRTTMSNPCISKHTAHVLHLPHSHCLMTAAAPADANARHQTTAPSWGHLATWKAKGAYLALLLSGWWDSLHLAWYISFGCRKHKHKVDRSYALRLRGPRSPMPQPSMTTCCCSYDHMLLLLLVALVMLLYVECSCYVDCHTCGPT